MKTQRKFRIPDFVDEDGSKYTDIEVIIESDGSARQTSQLANTVLTAGDVTVWPTWLISRLLNGNGSVG
jgi:hypothetical protein